MSTRKLLRREVKRTLLQSKLHHLQSLSCRMMNQKRSQLKSKNKEVILMTIQIQRTLTRKMEELMSNQHLRSGRWSSVTMMEGMHAFRPS
jgi:hypothetical protein